MTFHSSLRDVERERRPGTVIMSFESVISQYIRLQSSEGENNEHKEDNLLT